METLVLALSILLGGLLTTSGAAKIFDLSHFTKAVKAFQVLPQPIAVAYSLIVPPLELAAGLLLLLRVSVLGGSLLAVALFASFLAGVTLALARGIRPECGCLGILTQERIGPSTVVRLLALVASSAILVLSSRSIGIIPVGGSTEVGLTWLSIGVVTIPIAMLIGGKLWRAFQTRQLVYGLDTISLESESRARQPTNWEATLQRQVERRALIKASIGTIAAFAASLKLGLNTGWAAPWLSHCNQCSNFCYSVDVGNCEPGCGFCAPCCIFPSNKYGRKYDRYHVYNLYDTNWNLCTSCGCYIFAYPYCNTCDCDCGC